MAVDYGAGASAAIGAQYADLRAAIAGKGEAENKRKAEDIKRKGFLGTGITQDRLKGLADTGLGIAEFGQKRMAGQMDRATKSFERRRREGLDRITELRRMGPEGVDKIREIQAGMMEERGKYENMLGDYEGKGLFGTGFGSEGVGYKSTGDPSSYTKSLMESNAKKQKGIEEEKQAVAEGLAMQDELADEYEADWQSQPGQQPMQQTTFAQSEAEAKGGAGAFDPERVAEDPDKMAALRRDVRRSDPGKPTPMEQTPFAQSESAAKGLKGGDPYAKPFTDADKRRVLMHQKINDEFQMKGKREDARPSEQRVIPPKPKKMEDLIKIGKESASYGRLTEAQLAEAGRQPMEPTYFPRSEAEAKGEPGAFDPERVPQGLAEKALADAAPAKAAPKHEKPGEGRFWKGMSMEQLRDNMKGLPDMSAIKEFDDAFAKAHAGKEEWFIWNGEPFSTARK